MTCFYGLANQREESLLCVRRKLIAIRFANKSVEFGNVLQPHKPSGSQNLAKLGGLSPVGARFANLIRREPLYQLGH